VVLCADRGMVSEELLKRLRHDHIEYVVGARAGHKVEDALSYRGANWEDVDDLQIRIKPMGLEDETFIVCYNPKEAEHDRKRRKEILARLRERLHDNPSGSSLLRNTSFKSYVRIADVRVSVDEEKVRRAARYDGKYVLRTNAQLTHAEAARAYRQLFQIERAFRDLKGPLELRPIRHFTDRRIRGHIMVCFLAYALELALRQAMAGKGTVLAEHDYHQIMRDLATTTVATIDTGERVYRIRSPLQGRAHEAYAAIGLRPPNKVLEAPADDPRAAHQGDV
jgi:transposase